MCGRFNLTNPKAIEERFGFLDWHEKRITPRFNIAPSQDLVTIVQELARAPALQIARWGFAPFWDQSRRPPPINARAETLGTSALFREALRSGRCLIPASGFYEWQRTGGVRTPMHIRRRDEEPFAFAGLWTPPRSRGGVPTATIVTCAPNSVMARIHNRMPVILTPEVEGVWLDPSQTDESGLLALLRPYPAELLTAYAVSTRVNAFQNDGPDLVEPAPEGPRQPSLL